MHIDVKRAVSTLLVWWVIVEVALNYGLNKIPNMNWDYYTLVNGFVVGLVVGLTLMKFTGLSFGQALLIGLGWAGGQYAASYALNMLVSGISAISGILTFDLSSQLSQGMGNAIISNLINGFFTGAMGGLVISIILRRASVIYEGKPLRITLGWAVGYAIGYMAYYLLFNTFYQTNWFLQNMAIWVQIVYVVSDLLIITIGGLVMFKCIQDS